MKKYSGISTWENKKKATLEAKLKKMEANFPTNQSYTKYEKNQIRY